MIQKYSERGGVLFLILIGIALLAALSVAMIDEETGVESIADKMKLGGQVELLLTHMDTISNKVSLMVDVNLVAPANVKDLKLGDVGYTTQPHVDKIYHPLGGGIEYTDTIGDATGIVYHNGLTITGIGTATADIAMIAVVPSLAYCEVLNKKLHGSTTVPEITVASYGNITTKVAESLDDATTCVAAGGCDEVAYQCVTDGSGNYLYYHLLYAL